MITHIIDKIVQAFQYTRNRNGLRIEPCGTPIDIAVLRDFIWITFKGQELSLEQDTNNIKQIP